MLEFYQTIGGRRFIDGTMPRIADALEKIAAELAWHDCGEGPWANAQDALAFLENEVGARKKRLTHTKNGWIIEIAD